MTDGLVACLRPAVAADNVIVMAYSLSFLRVLLVGLCRMGARRYRVCIISVNEGKRTIGPTATALAATISPYQIRNPS